MSETDKYLEHYSVMNRDVLEFLKCDTALPVYADMTFGGGGHSLALAGLSLDTKVFAVDQDPQAYENGKKLIQEKGLSDRVFLYKTNFVNFKSLVDHGSILQKSFDGIVMDLGVSSHHFDSPERGFSFRFEAELDMRMAADDSSVMTAREIVNNYSGEELELIFKDYGEERFARRVAENIVEARSKVEVVTTKDLETIIFHSYPKNMRHGKIHPATRCFQALRIAVNRELDVLKDSIASVASLLGEGGKLAIISFHSLEDRIVKHEFKSLAQTSQFSVVTKRPLSPSEEELKVNSRSRSAKLRVLEKNRVI